ncbi:MAG: protein translocase subunit SecD [Dehalococcoidales bacterium]|nr:protein translocase subunit SecD [Dehalococcoidales bacterium]
MPRRNNLVFMAVLLLFVLSLLIVFPIEGGMLFGKKLQLGLDLKGGTHLVYQADLTKKDPSQTDAQVMAAIQQTIERRVNAYGVTEPVIQIDVSKGRITVQLPGVKDVDEAIKLIGQVALLEFKEEKLDVNGNTEWIPATAIGTDGNVKELTGRYLRPNSIAQINPSTSRPEVTFEWNTEGANLFQQITERNLNKPLGIFLDNQLVSAPTVQGVISNRGVITGPVLAEARTLAIQLNSGTLNVPLTVIQQKDVDATLGADSLSKSLRAGLIGIAMVVFFMIAYYRWLGALATIALFVYGAIVLAIFKLIPVTLTTAGIAGFIISVGMAVDANVLIFERMKEEMRSGRTGEGGVAEGFRRAWPSVRDSNVSTFITCFILYWFGSTSGDLTVKGFAVTLFIGVAVSMFSAITVTRTFLTALVRTQAGKSLLSRGAK